MKRIRLIGLYLAAVFSMSAVMAASASALPEFSGPFSKTFTSKSKASLLETVAKVKLTCKTDTNVGEVTGPETGFMTITFSGCKVKKVPCNTPGTPPGKIVTSLLAFTVHYINKANKEVGMDLVPAPGAAFAEFACGSAIRGIVIGSVIGRVTPINTPVKPTKFFTLSFTQASGKQGITNLEGGPIDTLETSFGGPFEESGLASTDRIKFGGVVELKA
jgi:hypothetical protein